MEISGPKQSGVSIDNSIYFATYGNLSHERFLSTKKTRGFWRNENKIDFKKQKKKRGKITSLVSTFCCAVTI